MSESELELQPKTVPEIRAEISRLKIDLWNRGLFVIASLLIIPLDVGILCVFWNWFIVPLGFHQTSYTLAFGLWITLRFMISSSQKMRPLKKWPNDPKKVWLPMLHTYLNRILPLISGSFLHLYLSHP